MAPVVVGYEESELREKLRKLRAKWNPDEKIWIVSYRLIRDTEFESRIPEEYLNGSKRL
jgi:ribosomal protein L19E